MGNKFLVSVANAVIRNASTGVAIAYGKANIESALELTTAETEVRGGINNALLYKYIHDRNVAVNITDATFDPVTLGLNVGSLSSNGSVTTVQTDCIVLDSGSGTLLSTPTSSNVSVLLPNDTWSEVTPTGSAIYVAGGGDQRVTAIYEASKTADQIVIGTTTPPSVVDLTLISEVRDADGNIDKYLQINVPRFQVDGNYTLSMTADGVSTQPLTGAALESEATDCSSGNYYAKVTWAPGSSSGSVAVSSIAMLPAQVDHSAAALPATTQLSVLGIRGGIYQNANVTANTVFSKTSGCAAITVSAGGLITSASSALEGESALIKGTYYDATSGSLFDYTNVTITA